MRSSNRDHIALQRGAFATVLFLAALFASAALLQANQKNKKGDTPPPAAPKKIDYSNIVWPNPPAIARIRYVNWYGGDNKKRTTSGNVAKKSKWMDRLAGTQNTTEVFKMPFQLIQPHGIAVDSQGNLFIADAKVGAIFIFNTKTYDVDLLKNGVHAHFARITGLAMDDDDRLFVSDPALRHVLILGKDHATPKTGTESSTGPFEPGKDYKSKDVITEGLQNPSGLGIDTRNRLLYVADVDLDQVLVYDADSLKLLRKIGTTGHNHELSTPGDFSKPMAVAVNAEGNLYVADTMNNRIEVFDADGTFIETYGKNGDGPGYFSRPKGVAIDGDGNIWVADGMQDRVQVFNPKWQLLISFGGHGLNPGQFQALEDIYIDKNNRVFTTEIFPGRAQEFQYVNEAEAQKERDKRTAEKQNSVATKGTSDTPAQASSPTAPQKN
jgi:sugar lactone lactonase YvrE